MKQLKPLLKIEGKIAALMSLVFLVMTLFGLMIIQTVVNEQWGIFLYRGISEFNRWDIFDVLSGPVTALMVAYSMGILMLVFFQYKNEHNIEINRFLKSLPFTSSQRFIVKFSVGLLSFTIPFIILIGGVLILKGNALALYEEIYKVTPLYGAFNIVNRTSDVVAFLVTHYMSIVMLYVFFNMMEYLISNHLGSIVIGVCILPAPYYIISSIGWNFDLEMRFRGLTDIMNAIYASFDRSAILPLGVNSNMGRAWEQIYFSHIGDISIRIIAMSILIVVFGAILLFSVRNYRVENEDILMKSKWTRILFIMGVTACSALAVTDLVAAIILPVLGTNLDHALYLTLPIGAVIGGVIATKIAHIGINQKKGVV